ncbi:hypothetical protein ACV229_10755 [Burkholderia sp. MR1-5-21]
MPVDLSPAGLPSAYPAHGPRFVPWLFGWVLCCGIGAAAVLLLWPAGTPAQGAQFWLCLLGIPNAVYFTALGIARAVYEADCLYALFRNRHRASWLRDRILTAQRPLQILGAGYCLPLGGKSIGEILTGKTSLLEARVPRSGINRIVHTRFADDDPLLQEDADESESFDDDLFGAIDIEHVEIAAPDSDPTPPVPVPVPSVVRVMTQALVPLIESLQALSQYGPKYAPAVRVMSAPETADMRVNQVRQALQRAGISDLECCAVSPVDGLMLTDAWLDTAELRPLLVVAAEWHAAPPLGSTEGAVAVLLGPGVFQLPELVSVMGLLHRPVADDLEHMDAMLANSVLWGKADAPTVDTAWISGLDGSHETKLIAALRNAGLMGVTGQDAQRRPDRIIGYAGTAGGWLSIAAALEAGPGTRLILHAPSPPSIAQAAILHVNDQTHNEDLNDERTQ